MPGHVKDFLIKKYFYNLRPVLLPPENGYRNDNMN